MTPAVGAGRRLPWAGPGWTDGRGGESRPREPDRVSTWPLFPPHHPHHHPPALPGQAEGRRSGAGFRQVSTVSLANFPPRCSRFSAQPPPELANLALGEGRLQGDSQGLGERRSVLNPFCGPVFSCLEIQSGGRKEWRRVVG